MLKVLIVDDEILIRVGLKSCIDWERHGFEIVGMAEDGEKALEIVREKQPDIMLTDIKMPGMDGLELIKRIKEQYPRMKFIVLTCYNEMNYIKQAMQLGAEDYILKLSVQPEILLQIMNKTREVIEKDRRDEQQSKKLEIKLQANKNIIKDSLYRKVLDGAITNDAFLNEIKNLGINIVPDNDILICCCIDSYKGEVLKRPAEEQQLFALSFRNMMEEILAEHGVFELAELGHGSFIILAASKQMSDPAHICEKMNNAARKYLNITLSFGILMNSEITGNLRESYVKAVYALNGRFYPGKESIIIYDESNHYINKQVYMDINCENQLLNLVEILDMEGAWRLIESFIEDLVGKKVYSPDSIRFSSLEVMHSMMKVFKKYNVQIDLYSSELNKNMSDILNAETAGELKEILRKFTQSLVHILVNVKSDIKRPEISRIMSYIHEHIERNITLAEAADICNISKCYFSTIFKREVGEGFCDYVNRVKMEKARDLILHSGLKSCEAAEKVGVYDESYFSKLFKKYIGKNPSELRVQI